MTFTVDADVYDRHVGRYSRSLGTALADPAGVVSGQTARAADVDERTRMRVVRVANA